MTPEHKALVEALTRKAETDGLLSVEDIRSVAESLSAQCAQPQAGEVAASGLYGPFGWLNGCRGLSEDSWELESDPLENSEEYFAIPLYALTDPFKEVGPLYASPQPANPAQGVADALKSAEKALRPFYDAVFNDNGDMTVDGPHDYDEAVDGYFAYKKIERAIAAIGAGGQAVAVKALEWDERTGAHYADTAFGEACVDVDGDGFYVIESGRKHSGFASVEAAQAFVQKHHDIWVKDWLDPSALAHPVQPGWRDIASAPKNKTPVIIAVPNKDLDGYTVGEAYFDPANYEGGDWWWAGTDYGDYYAGPISDVNHHPPEWWQPLPAAPQPKGE